MREITERLFAVLERKLGVLDALIEKQEALKQFLVEPNWREFAEVTRPQEGLLQALRETHAQQNALLDHLPRRKLGAKPTLRALAQLLDAQPQQRLESLRRDLAERVARLRKLSRLSHRLSQAQWEFAQACLAGGNPALASAQRESTYTANGYRGSAMPQQLAAGVYGDA